MRWCLAAFLRLWTNTYCATLLIVWSTSIVVQLLSHVWLFATPWTPVRQAPLSSIISQSLLKFMSIELVMPSNHLILCHPLLLPPSVFPSIRVFSTESVLHIRYWSQSIEASTSASVLPKNIQGWFPLGLISLISCSPRDSQVSFPAPQLESISSSVLRFLYGTTLTSTHDYWENHSFYFMDLRRLVMSLLFNMLSRFFIAFLPRSKHLLISWLESPSAVILEPKTTALKGAF